VEKLSGESRKEEKRIEIEIIPEYLDTPSGKKVATFDFVMGVAKGLEVLDETEAKLEERIERIEKGEYLAKLIERLDKFEVRIAAIEKTLSNLEKNIQTEIGDISDKVSALIDAFHELTEKLQRMETFSKD